MNYYMHFSYSCHLIAVSHKYLSRDKHIHTVCDVATCNRPPLQRPTRLLQTVDRVKIDTHTSTCCHTAGYLMSNVGLRKYQNLTVTFTRQRETRVPAYEHLTLPANAILILDNNTVGTLKTKYARWQL